MNDHKYLSLILVHSIEAYHQDTLSVTSVDNLYANFNRETKKLYDTEKQVPSTHITTTGWYHIAFDTMSLAENCGLVISGSYCISLVESDFNYWILSGIVIGTHLFGLLLKCIYYRFQHPSMSISEAHKCLQIFLNIVLGLMGTTFLIVLPYCGHLISQYYQTVTTSSKIIYISTGLLYLFVSIFFKIVTYSIESAKI